jgi:ATP sulfurylase
METVLHRMFEDGVLVDHKKARVAESLYETPSAEEQKEFAALKSVEIDVEQVEYLQTIAQGWAFPLNSFMNEMQLLEVIQMKTLTTACGRKHLFSVPIT